jgi:hypothetical protein
MLHAMLKLPGHIVVDLIHRSFELLPAVNIVNELQQAAALA